jgi:hypothetical protein
LGFFGAIRNQVGHQDFKHASDKEAFQALMLLDYLTEKLDAAAQRLGRSSASRRPRSAGVIVQRRQLDVLDRRVTLRLGAPDLGDAEALLVAHVRARR